MSDSEQRLEFVGRLGEEFVERFRRGERPALNEYTDKYPEHADDIRELFPALVMMEDLAPQDRENPGLDHKARQAAAPVQGLERLGDLHVIREVGRGGMGIVYEAEQLSLGRRVALKVLPQQMLLNARHKRRFEREAKAAARLHHTNIVPVFGVGEEGGLHYYIMQFIQGLGLDEVIDELQRLQSNAPPGETMPPTGELRVSKRQDIAAADVARSLMSGEFQPTILWSDEMVPEPVTAVRIADSEHGLSEGTSTSATGRLSDTFAVSSSSTFSLPVRTGSDTNNSRRAQTYWHSVAQIGKQVAEALQYAHEQGVLHRDIKPSNLLLDLRGKVWVTDFGLAKAGDQEDITHTGDVLGTLRYMPPEAFNGNTDARSDVYSLGLTLYELLALRPAFQEKDRNRLIKLVTSGVPDHLDKLNRNVPRDLSTIVHKAIEHEPARRYSSAGELAQDLQRFLDDEPIRARRITPAERFMRWTKHNKGLAAALAGLAAILVLVAVSSAMSARRFETLAGERQTLLTNATQLVQDREAALAAEQKAAQDAQAAKSQVEQVLVDMSVERGVLAAERGQNAEAVLWYAHAAQLAPGGSAARQDNLIRAVQYIGDVTRPVRMFEHPAEWVEELSFDPSGRYLLSYSVSRGATPVVCRLWDVERGEPLVLPEFSGILTAAAWSGDGRLAALGTSGGSVIVWDMLDRRVVRIVECDESIEDVAFSADGRMLGIAAGSLARVWDVQSEADATAPQPHPERIVSLTLSPDGGRVATQCQDNLMRVFACPSEPDQTLLPPLACRATGDVLAWEPQPLVRAQFVDDGQGVLFLGPDGLRYLDLARLECRAPNPRSVLGYCVSQGESPAFFSYGWREKELQTFPMGEELVTTTIEHRRSQPIHSAAFTSDGAELLTAGGDRRLNSWNVADGSPGRLALEHSSTVSAVCVSSEGRRFATAQQGGLVIVWERGDPSDKSPDISSVEVTEEGTLVCASRDGRMFAPTGQTSRDARIRTTQVFDARNREPVGERITVPGVLLDAHFSHDGNYLATLSSDGTTRDRYERPGRQPGRLRIWDWQSGEMSAEVVLGSEPRSLDISPDGDELAVLCVDGIVRVFDSELTGELKQWQAVEPFSANNWYIYNGALRFAPRGRRIVTWNTDRLVRVWNVDRGELEYSIDHGALTRDVAFSTDGRLLATSSDGSGEFTVRVTDLESGLPLAAPLPHPDWAFGMAFSPDGQLLVTACRDSMARVWDWRKGTLILPPLEHDHEVHACSFSPDGRFVVTAAEDRLARVWSALDGNLVMPPKPLSGSGRIIAWTGMSAVIGGFGSKLAVLDLERLDKWTDRDVADVVRFSELVTGRRVDAGGETPLTAGEWLDRYEATRSALPDAFALEFSTDAKVYPNPDAGSLTGFQDVLSRHWRRIPLSGNTELELVQRALRYEAEGNWPMAARDFLSLVRDNGWVGPKLAAILVDNGLLEDYRRLCEHSINEFQSTDQPYIALALVELCLLVPEDIPERQAARRLADLALTPQPDAPPQVAETLLRRSRMVRGLLAFRDGEFDVAIEWSRRAREGLDESQLAGHVPSLIVEGLAERGAGRDAEAADLFARAVSLLAAPRGNGGFSVRDRLLCRILLCEADLEPAEPADVEGLLTRGKVHLLLGRFSSAEDYFRRSLELNPDDHLLAYHLTTLLIALEDKDGLAARRQSLIERWGTTDDPTIAERTAKAYLLSPEPGPETARACELADLAVERGAGHRYELFFWHAKALAEYRRGNYDQSLDWSRRVSQSNDAIYPPLSIASRLLIAMSEERLGNTEVARLQLQDARQDFESRVASNSGLCPTVWSEDDLWCLVLQKEAMALIEGTAEAPAPSIP